ncbi:hypothetical protein ACETU7_02725 [Rhodococcus sp. 3Y1]
MRGAGPSLRPAVAVEGRTDGSPAQSEGPSPDAPPVDPGVPTDDIPWRDCTGTSLADQALAASSAGVILECAEFNAPIDVTGAIDGNFTAGLTRARTSSTPADAYPIVFTSGTDRSSGNSLAMLAASGLNTVLAEHPVVALDRRGIDRSTAIDCMTPEIRRGLHDLGQFDADSTGDAADAVAALGHDATIACTDYLDPQELKFGADSAAEDIDALRTVGRRDHRSVVGRVRLGHRAELCGGPPEQPREVDPRFSRSGGHRRCHRGRESRAGRGSRVDRVRSAMCGAEVLART